MGRMPASEPQKVTLRKELNDLHRQVDALTNQLSKDLPEVVVEKELLFSHPLVPLFNQVTPPYLIRDYNGLITRVDVSVSTVGTGNFGLDFRVNGVMREHIVLPAGDDLVIVDDLAVEIEEQDRLTFRVTSAGAVSTVTVRVVVAVNS